MVKLVMFFTGAIAFFSQSSRGVYISY